MNAFRPALWLLVCVLGFGACAQRQDDAMRGEAAAWVSEVRHAHEDADRALGRDDVDVARAALQHALHLQVPAQVTAEHQRAVHQDLLFRLASVELSRGAHREALQAADRGLALGRDDDVFTVNLLVVRGHALEAMDRSKDAALTYYEALQINQRLLSAVLAKDAGQL